MIALPAEIRWALAFTSATRRGANPNFSVSTSRSAGSPQELGEAQVTRVVAILGSSARS